MVYLFLLLAFAKPDANPWGKIRTPVSSPASQVYGSYTYGCLTNAETLPLDGAGYVVVNPYRNRYYAHPSLIRLIKTLGLWAQSKKLGKVIIGDLAQPAGGPLTGAHKSHQIGLDADIRIHLLTPEKSIKNKNNFNSTDVVTCKAQKKQIPHTHLPRRSMAYQLHPASPAYSERRFGRAYFCQRRNQKAFVRKFSGLSRLAS